MQYIYCMYDIYVASILQGTHVGKGHAGASMQAFPTVLQSWTLTSPSVTGDSTTHRVSEDWPTPPGGSTERIEMGEKPWC